MDRKHTFFSMAAAHQSINSTLCGIFLISWCLWVMVYYFTKTADNVQAYQDAFTSVVQDIK